jgi:hypothetical protein
MSNLRIFSKVSAIALLALLCAVGCGSNRDRSDSTTVAAGEVVEVQQGDATHPTVRKPFRRQLDNPSTSEDESLYQPVGYFGTTTILVHVPSGDNLPMDVDTTDGQVRRIYLPKGGCGSSLGLLTSTARANHSHRLGNKPKSNNKMLQDSKMSRLSKKHSNRKQNDNSSNNNKS